MMSSQSSASQDSQKAPESPIDISIPSTPTPHHASLAIPATATDVLENAQAVRVEQARLQSPMQPSSSEMTPPPSSQVPRKRSPIHLNYQPTDSSFPASPPATLKLGASALEVLGSDMRLKSEDLAKASEEQLRKIADELLVSLNEARMSAAHCKLQHQLLTLETVEAAKRSEIELEMTNREKDVLAAESFQGRASVGPSALINNDMVARSEFDFVWERCKLLEAKNTKLEKRLSKAKNIILEQEDHLELKNEEIAQLCQRIRDNRDHLNRLRDSGSISVVSTLRHEFLTPQRRAVHRVPGSARSTQDPVAALLAADHFLNAGSSVPSTPIQKSARPPKTTPSHTRGSHSLSSLPSTPSRPRPVTSQNAYATPTPKRFSNNQYAYSAPVSQMVASSHARDHHDRDSTISASDDEEAVTDIEEIPESQASSLARTMLRRNDETFQSRSAPSSQLTRNLSQGKIYGQITKAGTQKRKLDNEDQETLEGKKARLSQGVGLGIGNFSGSRN